MHLLVPWSGKIDGIYKGEDMPLQIRLSVPDFSSGVAFTDSIILDQADNIILSKSVNSSDEGISFTLPLNDPKMQYVDYLRWWEAWDTVTNQRVNYGPIYNIAYSSGDKKTITGPGRSALLAEQFKTVQTFYYEISMFLDDLLFENMINSPRATTLINTAQNNAYYGLSKRTKDNAIDEQNGYIAPGRDTPYQGTIKTNSFWAGTGKADWLTIDLGDSYKISKLRLHFPWWSGVTINNSATYDYSIKTSNDNQSFITRYTSPSPNKHGNDPTRGGQAMYFDGSGFEVEQINVGGGPITARYWKIDITNTHMWTGNYQPGDAAVDNWNYFCGAVDSYQNPGGGTTYADSPVDGPPPTDEIDYGNDCYASVVEFGALRKILDRKKISSKSYKQIDGSNWQIKFYHVPEASEMITTGTATTRKFEPGGYFRNIKVSWSGATSTFTIKDEFNNTVYTNGNVSGTNISVKLPAYCRVLQLEGSQTSQITYVDAWKDRTDAFSYGGSYSYSDIVNDYAIIHFKGWSFKWYSTVPSGRTAGQVKIELRSNNGNGDWSGWSTLENSYTLPTDIAGDLVYEIPDDGTLDGNNIYEIRITNLNGGFVSIDTIAGYWEGSFTMYNEDDPRFAYRYPNKIDQRYGSAFFGGSAYKWTGKMSPAQSLRFTGDRFVIMSRKSSDSGKMTIGLIKQDYTTEYGEAGAIQPIPGGRTDGMIEFTLTSSTTTNQAVIFDSADYTNWIVDGDTGNPRDTLPWDAYILFVWSESPTNTLYIDGIGVHELSGISAKFVETSHLEILKSTTEVLQLEWDIDEQGLTVDSRIGVDTDEILKEGTNTTIRIEEVQDTEYAATELVVTGADIDGLPLTGRVEDKVNRQLFGRTIKRAYDLRNVGDYFSLIGAARVELRRRRNPQKRVTISHTGERFNISVGDSFMIKTREAEYRVRANTIRRIQNSSSGTTYELECGTWPQII